MFGQQIASFAHKVFWRFIKFLSDEFNDLSTKRPLIDAIVVSGTKIEGFYESNFESCILNISLEIN